MCGLENCQGGFLTRPSDGFIADILEYGKKVATMEGSYCSHIEFDGKRYWDVRQKFDFKAYVPRQLNSSSVNRQDSNLLRQGFVSEAQEAKEILEIIQRNDRKLREQQSKN